MQITAEAVVGARDIAFERFGMSYRRFVALASWLARFVPPRWSPLVGAWLGRLSSPFLARAARLRAAVADALGAERADATVGAWMASHGRFAITLHRFDRVTPAWCADNVIVDDPQTLETIARRGGLLLTAHTHHHSTMFCVLGESGARLHVIASSAKASALYPYIGATIERINGSSQAHFRGGRYLYTDDLRQLVPGAKQAFAAGDVVCCLCDFSAHDRRTEAPFAFLGRTIRPPTGFIDLAVRAGVPVHVAMLFPDGAKLRLRVAHLEPAETTRDIVEGYLGFVEQTIRRWPWCWEGWDWFDALERPGAAADPEYPSTSDATALHV